MKCLWVKMKNIKRHIPQRTCVACRKVQPKRQLVRLVLSSDGNVEVDADGKKVGRGAYLCRDQGCWQDGLKSGRLEYALRTNLNLVNRERLIKYGEDLGKELVSG